VSYLFRKRPFLLASCVIMVVMLRNLRLLQFCQYFCLLMRMVLQFHVHSSISMFKRTY
jgi:hypothetical protein